MGVLACFLPFVFIEQHLRRLIVGVHFSLPLTRRGLCYVVKISLPERWSLLMWGHDLALQTKEMLFLFKFTDNVSSPRSWTKAVHPTRRLATTRCGSIQTPEVWSCLGSTEGRLGRSKDGEGKKRKERKREEWGGVPWKIDCPSWESYIKIIDVTGSQADHVRIQLFWHLPLNE